MANDINIVVSAQVGDATKGLQQVQQQVQRVDRQITRSTKALKANANQFNSTAVATNKFAKGALQQAGYQVGDFAVQLSGGQNAMQAFAQQGSQLAGIFGPMGAVIGAAIAIFGGVAAAVQRAKKAAADAAPKFETLAEASSALGAAFSDIEATDVDSFFQNNLTPAVRALKEEYSGLLEMMNLAAQERRADAIAGIMKNAGPAQEALNELRDTIAMMERGGSGPESDFMAEEAEAALARVRAELAKQEVISAAIASLNAGTREDALKQLRIVQEDLTRKGFMTRELRQQLDLYAKQSGLFETLQSQGKAASAAAEETAQAIIAQNDNYVGQDAIFRSLAARQANMAALANDMKASLQERNRFLADEDALMSQIVLKSTVLLKNRSVLGGRGQDPRQFTYLDEFRRQLKELQIDIEKPAPSLVKKTQAAANAIKTELTPAMKQAVAVGDMVGSSMESAMMSIVDGTKSVKDAFKSMASEIIKELYRIFVVKKITGMISSFIADPAMFGGLGGTSPVNGSVTPTMRPSGRRAMGGQVTGGRAYMVGERGPEMVVPSRNAHVVPNNQMGGGGVVVNQTINVSTGVQQTVRTEIKTLMPQIADAAKAAVADAKLRGGSYGRSFA